jgi:hypothetical protein
MTRNKLRRGVFCEETDDLARALFGKQLDIGIVSVPEKSNLSLH